MLLHHPENVRLPLPSHQEIAGVTLAGEATKFETDLVPETDTALLSFERKLHACVPAIP